MKKEHKACNTYKTTPLASKKTHNVRRLITTTKTKSSIS